MSPLIAQKMKLAFLIGAKPLSEATCDWFVFNNSHQGTDAVWLIEMSMIDCGTDWEVCLLYCSHHCVACWFVLVIFFSLEGEELCGHTITLPMILRMTGRSIQRKVFTKSVCWKHQRSDLRWIIQELSRPLLELLSLLRLSLAIFS